MPCKRVSLSIGAPLGNLEGIRLLGLFEWKGLYSDTSANEDNLFWDHIR